MTDDITPEQQADLDRVAAEEKARTAAADVRAQETIAALVHEREGYEMNLRIAEDAKKAAETDEETKRQTELVAQWKQHVKWVDEALKEHGHQGAAPAERAEVSAPKATRRTTTRRKTK